MTPSIGMLTDRYELTMIAAALRDGTAATPCVFEVFTRRLPQGRRYGVVAGTARVLQAIREFGFSADDIAWLREAGAVDEATADFLRGYRFSGSVRGFPEGEVYFPDSPILTVRASFAEAIILETVVLSILNHDAAVAAAASRMVTAARGRPIIEMGSRRTHDLAAPAASRAAYLAGFMSTSNLAAGSLYGVPTGGTAAHSFTLLYPREADAFRSQIATHGAGTTLLVDTYDITQGIANAVEVAGPALGAIRIDSGDLEVLAQQARAQLDSLGNHATKIIVSGDLDEYAIAGLAAAPVDVYGAGTSVVVGSGAPTAGFVYKLVEADGRAVAKRSAHKATAAGGKFAARAYRTSGVAVEEIVVAAPQRMHDDALRQLVDADPSVRRIDQLLIADGEVTDVGAATLHDSRELLAATLRTLPWEALALSRGDAALPTRLVHHPFS